MDIKPTKFSAGMIASFITAMEVVIYRDLQDRLYRLRYVDNEGHSYNGIEELYRVMCVSRYAPEIIDGEIIEERSDEVHVKVGSDIYVLQKNAGGYGFQNSADRSL